MQSCRSLSQLWDPCTVANAHLHSHRRLSTAADIEAQLELLSCCAGERLVEELAPELVPMLQSIEMPANFVPVTNAVLAEMARRGIGRQQILTALRTMGSELPQDSVQMIQVGYWLA